MQLAGVGGPIVVGGAGENTTSIDDLDALQIQTHPLVTIKVCPLSLCSPSLSLIHCVLVSHAD